MRGGKLLGVALFALAVSGGVAQAASVKTPGAWAYNKGSTLYAQDIAEDGDSAYANWNKNKHNRIQTQGGDGSATSVEVIEGLKRFRACRDVSHWPDNCSSWVEP